MARFDDRVERKEVIAEVGRRSYEAVRISRLWFKDNPEPVMDIRVFNINPSERDWDDDGELYPTKTGVMLSEHSFERLISKWTLIPGKLFHPAILGDAWKLFGQGYKTQAVFEAFKEVEQAVREAGGFKDGDVGVKLMRKAFATREGPLSDPSTPDAEQEATAHMFSGAIGHFKNPSSHRDVEYEHAAAFEALLLASHLLRIVERRIGRPLRTDPNEFPF